MNEKADQILLEGLLTVERIERIPAGRLIVAHCRSRTESDKVYKLGFDPKVGEWRCTCPVTGKRFCSHLVALQRVTTEVRPAEVIQS
jgi:uncharacterized Zn finger protein